MTQAEVKALAEQKQSKEENPTVNWQDGTLLMTVGSGWFQSTHTGWYKCFIEYPDRDNPRFLKKFRLKFRIPLHNFEELAVSLEDEAVFRHWHCNHHGKAERLRSAPIPLLLLTSLQYMGRALTLDDFEELCWTDGDVIRVFLHVFLKVGRTDLYESYI